MLPTTVEATSPHSVPEPLPEKGASATGGTSTGAGVENDFGKRPKVVDKEPCISPAEQSKLARTTGPKTKGHPRKGNQN